MQEDVLLVKNAINGDKEAFCKLMRKHYRYVYTHILSIVKSPEDAEELTNDVFVKVYLNISSLKNYSSFQVWLNQIIKRSCQDWLRQQRGQYISIEQVSDIESKSLEDSPENEVIYQERLNHLFDAIERLSEIDRSLVKSFYLDGVPYKTLQQEHNLTKGMLNNRLVRAKRKIRDQIKKLLAGFSAIPYVRINRILLMGVVEMAKISVKTKIISASLIAIFLIGGTGGMLYYLRTRDEQSSNNYAVQQNQNEKPSSQSTKADITKNINIAENDQERNEHIKSINNEEFNPKTSESQETKGPQKIEIISPEHISIGMILDPNKEDIPGAKYELQDFAGRKVKVPINLPDGYATHFIFGQENYPDMLVVIPKDGAKIILMGYEKDGVRGLFPPEEGWEIFQNSQTIESNVLFDDLLKGRISKEEFDMSAKTLSEEEIARQDELIKRYGNLHTHISSVGTSIAAGSGQGTTIVIGSDGQGWFRSIVNP